MPGLQLQFTDEKDYLTFLESVFQQGPKLLSEEGFMKVLEQIAMIGRYHGIQVEGKKIATYQPPNIPKKDT